MSGKRAEHEDDVALSKAGRTGPGAAWDAGIGGSDDRWPADEATFAASTGRRLEVLEAVRRASRPLRISELAVALQMHPNTVRFHLEALKFSGRLERVTLPPAGRGRPALAFRMRPGMDLAGPRRFRLLAEILAGAMAAEDDPVSKARTVGSAWGGQLVVGSPGAAEPTGPTGEPGNVSGDSNTATADREIRRLVEVLDDLGFAPQLRLGRPTPRSGRQIDLRHCPFLELAQAQPVICALHLGLMQGVAAANGSAILVDRLVPFAQPDLCTAHLSAAS